MEFKVRVPLAVVRNDQELSAIKFNLISSWLLISLEYKNKGNFFHFSNDASSFFQFQFKFQIHLKFKKTNSEKTKELYIYDLCLKIFFLIIV